MAFLFPKRYLKSVWLADPNSGWFGRCGNCGFLKFGSSHCCRIGLLLCVTKKVGWFKKEGAPFQKEKEKTFFLRNIYKQKEKNTFIFIFLTFPFLLSEGQGEAAASEAGARSPGSVSTERLRKCRSLEPKTIEKTLKTMNERFKTTIQQAFNDYLVSSVGQLDDYLLVGSFWFLSITWGCFLENGVFPQEFTIQELLQELERASAMSACAQPSPSKGSQVWFRCFRNVEMMPVKRYPEFWLRASEQLKQRLGMAWTQHFVLKESSRNPEDMLTLEEVTWYA